MSESERATGGGYQFGTFKGVFTPSILTILGVVMYLRFGWVLGNVGLPLTLLIVTMATAITFFTGLSLAAIATNMRIGAGGAYYIISRSLGPEVGGAIGLPLFLAQALGIAFYISGFAESITATVDLAPYLHWLPFALTPERLVAVVMLAVLAVIAAISADLALKTQFLVMAAIAVSLVSFFMGSPPKAGLLAPDAVIPTKLAFWAVFAVFFPAVTGIEAGIAMSGDLKKPSRALPLGTIGAVVAGYVVYMAIPIFLAHVISDESLLLVRPLIMRDIARWGGLILIGVWAASLSSAMGSLLGAPRTLQALARDGVIPRFLGRGYGENGDPRLATLVSFGVALAAILLGDLNLIAPVLTMFFLTSYGLINLSAGLEGLIGSPSWRPAFRLHWSVSLLGAFACFSGMFMINPGATFLAGAVTGTVYYLLKRRNLRAQWGDMRYGILMLLARFAIDRLARRRPDERGWRPNILAFSGSPEARPHLVELAQALARGPACLTLATIVPTSAWSVSRGISLQQTMADALRRRGMHALVKVFPADSLVEGLEDLVKGYGFGPIVPNTVLVGETGDAENVEGFVRLIELIHQLQRNLVIVRDPEHAAPSPLTADSRIDVWWAGSEANIGLMLTLAGLLRMDSSRKDTRLVVKRIVQANEDRDKVQAGLQSYLSQLRTEVETQVIANDGREIFDIIRSSSLDATMVFMGMCDPDKLPPATSGPQYYRTLMQRTEGLPVVLVLAAENIRFTQVLGLD
jgi:amino acid transporter